MADTEILPYDGEPLDDQDEYGLLENDDEDVVEEFTDVLDPDDEAAEVISDEELPPIGRSWAFDFGLRQFISLEGSGPLETRGDETLKGWIEKCLNTQKGVHPIYSDDFGLTDPRAMIGQSALALDAADLESEIIEALTFHPRITNVKDFEINFVEEQEALYVGFTVIHDDEDEMVLEGLRLA